jgi:hypothetical protein
VSNLSLSTLEPGVEAIAADRGPSWTAVTAGIGAAAKNIAEGWANTAATYQALGERMINEAARQAAVISKFADGVGLPAERAMFKDVANTFVNNTDSMPAAPAGRPVTARKVKIEKVGAWKCCNQ